MAAGMYSTYQPVCAANVVSYHAQGPSAKLNVAGSAGAAELPGVAWQNPDEQDHHEAALHQGTQGCSTPTGQLPHVCLCAHAQNHILEGMGAYVLSSAVSESRDAQCVICT